MPVNTEDRGYLYDAAWNLNQRTNNGVVGTFNVDNKNQLTNDPSFGTESFDSNGNLHERIVSSSVFYDYGYDDENRLTAITNYSNGQANGPTWVTLFTYDGRPAAAARRVQRCDCACRVFIESDEPNDLFL